MALTLRRPVAAVAIVDKFSSVVVPELDAELDVVLVLAVVAEAAVVVVAAAVAVVAVAAAVFDAALDSSCTKVFCIDDDILLLLIQFFHVSNAKVRSAIA